MVDFPVSLINSNASYQSQISFSIIISLMSKKYKKHLKNYTIFLEEIIRQDSYSKVMNCKNNETGQAAIVRVYKSEIINGNQLIKKSFYLQIYIMKMLTTQKILKFLDVFESEHNFYIFMEYPDGGNLKQAINQFGKLSQKNVISYLRELLNVFEEMETKHLIHGNIRPQNLFIKNSQLKLGFFGNILTLGKMGNKFPKKQLSYSAPQILAEKRYNNKCDIWSLGVTLYEVLFGYLPWDFTQKNLEGILNQIETEEIKFPKEIDLSKEMEDFICKCLAFNKDDRMSWPEVFIHPIFQSQNGGLHSQPNQMGPLATKTQKVTMQPNASNQSQIQKSLQQNRKTNPNTSTDNKCEQN